MKFNDNIAVNIILNHQHHNTRGQECCMVEGITVPMTEYEHAEHVAALIEALPTDSPMSDLTEHVRFISATISDSYPNDLDPEAHTWRRVMKVAEEVGEVTAALLGNLGENVRKGQTHTPDDLRDELLDVALAALGAVSHLGADGNDTVALLNARAEFVHHRLSLAVTNRVAAIYPPVQRTHAQNQNPTGWEGA